ncbi:MAG TPA: DUF2283 domain-containing protein [Firmicutes bacterium]|nr:DUF2283 domain-containing protein [Bacillota bacterium]
MAEISNANLMRLIARAEYGTDTEEALFELQPLYISFEESVIERVLGLANKTLTFTCADGTEITLDLNKEGKVIGMELL